MRSPPIFRHQLLQMAVSILPLEHLPLVQLGYARSRVLFELAKGERELEVLLHAQVQKYLTAKLASLPLELSFPPSHFLLILICSHPARFVPDGGSAGSVF